MGQGEGKTVRIFIVDGDEMSAALYMSICRMLKDAEVYVCSNSCDAVKLAASVIPDIMLISCQKDGCEEKTLKEISKANGRIVTVAIGKSDDFETEGRMLKAGALNYLSKPVDNDRLFFTIKNIASVFAHPHVKSIEKKGRQTKKENRYFQMIRFSSYADMIGINKKIGKLTFSKKLEKNIAYVRFLSFLYDFFVKSFLEDKNLSAGFFINEERLTALFLCDESLRRLLESSVFYEQAEKYITFDGDFCVISMDAPVRNGDTPAEYGFDIQGEIPCFSHIYEKSGRSSDEKILDLNKAASAFAKIMPFFSYFGEYMLKNAAVINLNVENTRLKDFFSSLDEEIYNLRARDIPVRSNGAFEENIACLLIKIMLAAVYAGSFFKETVFDK